MKRLDELFEIRNGLASTNVEVTEEQDDEYSVMYVCPSKTQQGAIAGWVNPATIDERHIYPAGTLHVSADGAGSHTYSYVSATPFVPTHHVRVLLPWQPKTELVLRYYAYLITKNRHKFSYGRAPRGERLAKLLLPEAHELPEWLDTLSLARIEASVDDTITPCFISSLPSTKWKRFKLTELFLINNGRGPTLQEARRNAGSTPYVTRSAANNGVAAWTDWESEHSAGCITVATDANAGEAFYQPQPFCAYSAVAVFEPHFKIDEAVGLFLATLIRFEGTAGYSYSRAWSIDRMKESSIWVPVTCSGEPDFSYMRKCLEFR